MVSNPRDAGDLAGKASSTVDACDYFDVTFRDDPYRISCVVYNDLSHEQGKRRFVSAERPAAGGPESIWPCRYQIRPNISPRRPGSSDGE